MNELFENSELLFEDTEYHFSVYRKDMNEIDRIVIYTSGLQNYAQPVSDKTKQPERIELYFLLPGFWNLENKNWPVEWLKKIARVPQKNNTWFGYGDTVPAGNPKIEIDETLKCTTFILWKPIEMENLFARFSDFSFLCVIPIFEKEFDHKMQNGHNGLMQKFKEKNLTELVDIYREPVARKKFMGLF